MAFTAAIVFWPLHVHWLLPLPGVNGANFGAGMLLLGASFALFGALVWLGHRGAAGSRWAVDAAAWAACEYARLHVGFASTPWGSLAYSQIELAPLVQLASVTGIYGVSFVVVGVAAAIAEGADRLIHRGPLGSRSRVELVAPLLLAAVVIAWGATRLGPTGDAQLRVALVQAGLYERSVDPRGERREVLERYGELTRRAVAEGADLVTWPASSVPGSIPFDRGLAQWLGARARELGTPLLIGASGQEKSHPSSRVAEPASANSAFLIAPNGEIAGQYDKIRLLPFNEYLPLRGRVRWPAWVGGNLADARAGESRTVFQAAGARFGVLICWENLFPDGFRSQVARGLDFVVSMTNEAFTDDPSGHHQMLSMNRFRAVEGGLPVIRIATTGVSAAIDSRGRISQIVTDGAGQTQGAIGYRLAGVPIGGEPSFYVRYGDWFPAACLAGLCLAIGGSGLRRRSGALPDA